MYKKTNEWYKGEWCYNVRQGQGTLFTKEKNTFTVSFRLIFIFERVISVITGPTATAQYCSTMDLIIMAML